MTDYKLKTPEFGKKASESIHNLEKNFTDKFLEPNTNSEFKYTLKTGKLGQKFVKVYKKIENTFVNRYQKIEDKFVDAFLEPVEPKIVDVIQETDQEEE
jgi:hypothetical protein